MPFEIRRYDATDLRPFLFAMHVPFGHSSTDSDLADHERYLERDRLVAAYDGATPVGTGAALSLRLTIPGGEVPAGGVTEISVLPSHRRRGALRGIMSWLLDDVRSHGEPVAILWASEAAIYPRFGYGIATLVASFEVPASAAAFRDPPADEGSIRFVEGDAVAAPLRDVYERTRPGWPGFVTRTPAMWEIEVFRDRESDRAGAGPTLTALHEVDGVADGYVRYRMREAWGPGGHDNTVEVRELVASAPRAERALWRFLLDLDLTARVRAILQPVDTPLFLLLAEPRRMRLSIGDGLLLRIVDVPAALEARGYTTAGSVVLGVTDATAPWNTGRWRLTAEARDAASGCLRAAVERTDDPADIELAAPDLGSAYLGGFSFASLARAGRAVELAAGALACADSMFAVPRAPWCFEEF